MPGRIFGLQPGNESALLPLTNSKTTRLREKELANVSGMTCRVNPAWLAGNGSKALKFIDECAALCEKMGKLWTLLVMGGVQSPWTADNVKTYQNAAKTLGARYGAAPGLWGVHATGGSQGKHSEELYGQFTPQWGRAVETLIDAWADAFRVQRIILAGAPNDPTAMLGFVEHGVGVAPGRFLYKHNAMSAKQGQRTGPHAKLQIQAMKAGALGGCEMLDNSTASRFVDAGDKTPVAKRFAKAMANVAEIERLAGKRFEYIAPYRQDFAASRAFA